MAVHPLSVYVCVVRACVRARALLQEKFWKTSVLFSFAVLQQEGLSLVIGFSGVEDLKRATRRYAKYQVQWVTRRFLTGDTSVVETRLHHAHKHIVLSP